MWNTNEHDCIEDDYLWLAESDSEDKIHKNDIGEDGMLENLN